MGGLPWHPFLGGLLALPRSSWASPAAVALACGLLLAAALLVWRDHAVGSQAVPAGVRQLPGSLPLLGHAVPVLRNLYRMHDFLAEGAAAMGEGTTWAFTLPAMPTFYLVTNPKCVEHMLKGRPDNYIKGRHFYRNFREVLGHGIFTSDGPDWYWQRKLAVNVFSVSSFRRYIDTVFDAKLQTLASLLAARGAAGAPIDLHDLMYRFTLDSFGQIGFGVDIGALTAEGKVPFAAAFDASQVVMNLRFWRPFHRVWEVLTGEAFSLAANAALVQRFALSIIARRRQQLAAEGGTAAGGADSAAAAGADGAGGGGEEADADAAPPRDLLSLFLDAKGPDGQPLTTQQLVDAVLNFIIAGRDTTAQALSWSFYLVMRHPSVEAKLLEEARRVLGSPGRDGAGGAGSMRPTYEQLRQLRYARAVFLEALRLYPSVPENVKFAVAADTLPDGAAVPAGAQLVYSPYVSNRLASVWGPDALAFRPERWLDMAAAPSAYSYLTFNAGPRLCLGQRLAELEGVFVLTGLLLRFRFAQASADSEVRYQLSTTMPMAGGLQVLVAPRE